MDKYIPQIHILYAFPFDSIQREFFKSKETDYPTVQEILKDVEYIGELWSQYNKNDVIIQSLIKIITINPGYDYEFYLYGKGRIGSISVPLMLCLYKQNGRKLNDVEILETLIHEIIHRFASSPRKELIYKTKKYWEYIFEEYKDLAPIT